MTIWSKVLFIWTACNKGWLHGSETCAVTQGPTRKKTSHLAYCSAGGHGYPSNSFICKNLLSIYYMPGTPLGTEDETDTNPGQARADNYVKHRMSDGGRCRGREQDWDEVRSLICTVYTHPVTTYHVTTLSTKAVVIVQFTCQLGWTEVPNCSNASLGVTVKEFFRFFDEINI